jgi:hypothetical protein
MAFSVWQCVASLAIKLFSSHGGSGACWRPAAAVPGGGQCPFPSLVAGRSHHFCCGIEDAQLLRTVAFCQPCGRPCNSRDPPPPRPRQVPLRACNKSERVGGGVVGGRRGQRAAHGGPNDQRAVGRRQVAGRHVDAGAVVVRKRENGAVLRALRGSGCRAEDKSIEEATA